MERKQTMNKKELNRLTKKYCSAKHCRGETGIKGIACGAYTHQIQIKGRMVD